MLELLINVLGAQDAGDSQELFGMVELKIMEISKIWVCFR